MAWGIYNKRIKLATEIGRTKCNQTSEKLKNMLSYNGSKMMLFMLRVVHHHFILILCKVNFTHFQTLSLSHTHISLSHTHTLTHTHTHSHTLTHTCTRINAHPAEFLSPIVSYNT